VKPARPLYFPVTPEPLRMQAGLVRFGSDFGNGEADQRFFPRDATTPHYLDEKARVLAGHPARDAYAVASDSDEGCVRAAQAWLCETLQREGQGELSGLARSALGRELVEDFAVLRLDETGADRTLWLHACFPSGWRPEHVIGQSFAAIHARIPAFEAVARKATSLVEAMVTRGPYVRFVWTISADDELDHHPDEGRRLAWSAETARGFLRVERQTIVPLPASASCVFLIRTYLYEFAELSRENRAILATALQRMPPEILRYKGLSQALPRALELLR
jgi:dimethylamine monooxygenase subunit A